jgi:ferredoxin-NADP reductase
MFAAALARPWQSVSRPPRATPLLKRGLSLVTPWVDQLSARLSTEHPLLEASLAWLDPTLSLHSIKARVVSIREETADVKTYVLKPNARFGRYVPGAYVTLRLRIDGKLVQRAYSLSSAPTRDGLISITVKRVQGGQVSNWMADHVAPGDVLELSAPQGKFLLPAQPAQALLMISAGSGITPVMSMLRHLVRKRSTASITFLHFARSARDVIFEHELRQIASSCPNVKIVTCVEQAEPSWQGPSGRFSQELLEQSAPDFRGMQTFLCGPAPFMRAVMQSLEQSGADLSQLRFERFGVDFNTADVFTEARVVRFTRSQVESISNRSLTILQEAEARGVAIESGCRAGTCGTCRCTKKRGVVLDIVTGQVSGDGEELIFPCVSMAQGSVEVEL